MRVLTYIAAKIYGNMADFFLKLSKEIDRINEWVGRTSSWISGILVILVCIDVLSRYLFSETAAWVMELEWHLFSLLFLFGAGFALKHDRHVRVDLFYDKFSPKDKALVNLIGGLVFLLPWCLLIGITSFGYAYESFLNRETSPDPGGLPARYVIKFAVTLGLVLLLLQGISQMIKDYRVWKGLDLEEPREFNESL